MRYCVYGGGNIAHSLVAAISNYYPVTVVTRRPELWGGRVVAECNSRRTHALGGVVATSDVSSISGAGCIFIALPQFVLDEVVDNVLQYAKSGSIVFFVPAPAKISEYAEALRKKSINVVAFQRVPFISRIRQYGHIVSVSESRSIHRVAFSESVNGSSLNTIVNRFFGGDIRQIRSFHSLAFSNSNPLLHPSRMVVLFRDWQRKQYPTNPMFYAEWTDESSELYLAADSEMCNVMMRFPEIDLASDYESVLEHYQVRSASELTLKLRSIAAFRNIASPMVETPNGWIPDFESRYFTEDIDYGTKSIYKYANKVGVRVPTIKYLIDQISHIRS